jgi:hypothetical protein
MAGDAPLDGGGAGPGPSERKDQGPVIVMVSALRRMRPVRRAQAYAMVLIRGKVGGFSKDTPPCALNIWGALYSCI